MKTAKKIGDGSESRTGSFPVATGSEKPAKLEVCHPSVCVGGTIATNCICPTTTKK